MAAPWDGLPDEELREHLDLAMFVMVEIAGLDLQQAWHLIEGPDDDPGWPDLIWSPRRRAMWFHHSAVDHALDLAWGGGWWLQPVLHAKTQPRTAVHAQYAAALADGSWQARKRSAFP